VETVREINIYIYIYILIWVLFGEEPGDEVAVSGPGGELLFGIIVCMCIYIYI